MHRIASFTDTHIIVELGVDSGTLDEDGYRYLVTNSQNVIVMRNRMVQKLRLLIMRKQKMLRAQVTRFPFRRFICLACA